MPYCRFCLKEYPADQMPSPRTCINCRKLHIAHAKKRARRANSVRNSRLKKAVDYFFMSKRIKHPLFEHDKEAIKELVVQVVATNRYKKRLLALDHIVPVNHKLVSGLTVSWNLQVLLEYENASKGNSVNLEAEAEWLLQWAKDRGL